VWDPSSFSFFSSSFSKIKSAPHQTILENTCLCYRNASTVAQLSALTFITIITSLITQAYLDSDYCQPLLSQILTQPVHLSVSVIMDMTSVFIRPLHEVHKVNA
jgi:hypothetical protein